MHPARAGEWVRLVSYSRAPYAIFAVAHRDLAVGEGVLVDGYVLGAPIPGVDAP
jgi:hypothetical protein